ncbi:PREDICTED: uncharacterized protein LOC108566497 [Nicrophorus vespilloides]|uniref:Uncharacterized protein LOC108566497 n=1 Tax=Nicrophorus vespilloides TaxID=110193 RepID=A0ABM1N4Z0_NICVS|nr:PREDICTED: uncharacterized protein LOC108566497 [Nicrophorus vespilloides]
MTTFVVGTVLVLALALAGTRSQAPYFYNYDDVTIEDPLAYIWNNRDNLIQDSYAPCGVKYNAGRDREGTCMHSSECKFNRGKTNGRGSCSFWNSCCISEKTCNQRTNSRVSYFMSPSDARKNFGNCEMQVDLINENICQIRIDIIDMKIQDPVLNGDKLECEESFTVSPESGTPKLCGGNKDTHFYVHLDKPNNLNNAVKLNMKLKQITGGIIEPNSPRWNIKVTQLECPSRDKKFALQHKKDTNNRPAEDFHKLAPEGCLQYFTEPSGTIQSFGYESSKMSMITAQDYAICFKRSTSECGIKFTSNFLDIDAAGCANNFIHTPETTLPDDAKVCFDDAPKKTWLSVHPGPLYVHVHTEISEEKLQGFNINYVMKGC